jgi:hypothetical protein
VCGFTGGGSGALTSLAAACKFAAAASTPPAFSGLIAPLEYLSTVLTSATTTSAAPAAIAAARLVMLEELRHSAQEQRQRHLEDGHRTLRAVFAVPLHAFSAPPRSAQSSSAGTFLLVQVCCSVFVHNFASHAFFT